MNNFTGVIADVRSEAQKLLDWKTQEMSSGLAPSVFADSPQIITSPYPLENQQATSSCIPHGVTLAYGIETQKINKAFARLSKMMPYRLRSNYPGEGMYLQECMNIMNNVGSCLFETMPDVTDENTANSLVISPEAYNEGLIYAGVSYYSFTDSTDFDLMAQFASNNFAVPIVIWASLNEWVQQYVNPTDTTITEETAVVQHCICVLPNGNFTINGTRYVTIQDSEPWGGFQIRYVSEAFIRARCKDAAVFIKENLQFGIGSEPIHTFDTTQTLSLGMTGAEVTALQNVLIYEGLLPANLNTSYFGGRTYAGVKAFQDRYASDILTLNGLTSSTGIAGPATLAKMNSLYGS